jgi:5'-nucleotidase
MPTHRPKFISAVHNLQSIVCNPQPATLEPLILVTNDDGIASPGLRAATQAALPLGEVLVVAPARQWSGAGRSMPRGDEGRISRYPLEVDGQPVMAYQVDSSPALVVVHAVLELVPYRPALLISGINYGENMGTDITVSGTVGAALQGADLGIPALAVSLQTPKETHANPSDNVDFSAAIHFTRLFARWMLQVTLPFDTDVLKLDVPDDATPETPWRLTRVSRHAYFVAAPPQRTNSKDAASPPPLVGRAGGEKIFPLVGGDGERETLSRVEGNGGNRDPFLVEEVGGHIDYNPLTHPERTEPDSDIYALAVDHVVSVAPVSLNLTARVDRGEMEALLHGSVSSRR